MSEFCRNCPMSGMAQGQLKDVIAGPLEYTTSMAMGLGPQTSAYEGNVASIIGENGGVSYPIHAPSNKKIFERVAARVEACKEPYTEERGIWRPKRYVTGCPALGEYAVHEAVSMRLQNAFQQQVNLQNL